MFKPLTFIGLLLLFAFSLAEDTPIEWYDTNGESFPAVKLDVEQSRDANVFDELKIRAILAVLKLEIAESQALDLSSSDRRRLIDILDDPNLTISYTGKQSLLAHSTGGQVIDDKTILINQEGFYYLGAPKSPYEIGKILLHELAHVYQERHNFANLPGFQESWPEELEAALSPTNFSRERIDEMQSFISQGSSTTGLAGSIERSIVFVLDASGSMEEDGRLEQAKVSIRDTLRNFSTTTEVALLVFFDCGDIRKMHDFTTNFASLEAVLPGIQPASGTPLAAAIDEANAWLASEALAPDSDREWLMLSDGEESCNGDAVSAAKR